MPDTAPIGHNGQLQSFIDRLERFNEDKAIITNDFAEVIKEARSAGYDPKIIRKVLKIRAADPAKLAEEEALIETYIADLA